MAEKRVVVYYMHESEEVRCHQVLRDATWSSGHAMGSLDESEIVALEAEGVVVEELEAAPEPAAGDGFRALAAAGPVRAASLGLEGAAHEAVLHPTKDNVFTILIEGPYLMPDWQRQLAGLGVAPRERLPDGRLTAFLSLAQVPRVRALPFVREVRLFAPEETASAVFSETGGDSPAAALGGAAGGGALAFDVLLHRPDDLDDVRAWLDERAVTILAAGRRKLRVELPARSPRVREIEALPEVRQIAEYVEPTLANQMARRLLGLDASGNPSPGAGLAETGDGEIVAVADSGLDDEHPDFQGRIVRLVARARAEASDIHGHGTHVAGSAVGDGAGSGGAHKGTAPGARLFFQSIMDESERLSGLPVELGELFEEAYAAGARIHNNSWSAHTKSFYTLNSLEVDEYVHSHPDLLVTIAAGNEGSAADPFSAQPGFVDWVSIGSPATAKNALTVGASRNLRNEGGFADRTYRQFNASRFPAPPIADQNVSGDAECLAAFSARGPCDPQRIKPDVVAPGTDILSTRATTAPKDNFWGLLADDEHYGYMGGTSMATPLVSGCAALVREHYRKTRGHEPSAALVKATLINSTRRLSGACATADHDKLPNFHQGFGAVSMPLAIPNPREPWMRLHFVDTWKGGPTFQSGGSDRARYAFTVGGGAFLRVCLVWTDPPAGSSLQNVLGLMLEHHGLTPPKRMGNEDRPNRIHKLDRDNNVQIIRIEQPPAGNYLLQVFAANLLTPQDWALVVTGDVADELVAV
jgi:serine protease AprX